MLGHRPCLGKVRQRPDRRHKLTAKPEGLAEERRHSHWGQTAELRASRGRPALETHPRLLSPFFSPALGLSLFSCSVVSDSLRSQRLRSSPGSPVLHHLPQFAQTHAHCVVGDAIQPFCPLSSPSPPAFSISPSNEYSGLISFRMAGLTSLQSKGLSRVFSAPQFGSIDSSALSLPYGLSTGLLCNPVALSDQPRGMSFLMRFP